MVRQALFGEWTVDEAVSGLMLGGLLGFHSSVGSFRHLCHPFATLCLNDGLYGGGGDLVSEAVAV